MQKISVLEVIEPSGLGGAPRYVFDLLSAVDMRSFDVMLVYSSLRSDQDLDRRLRELRERGVAILEIPMSRSIHPLKDVRAFARLYDLMRSRNFDIVHCHSSKAGFLGRICAKLANKRTVTIYTPHLMAYNLHQSYWFPEKFASLFTDLILANSESERRELVAQRIIRPEKVAFVFNGLPAGTAVPQLSEEEKQMRRQRFGVGKADVIIASGGRLVDQKDPLTYLRAARQLLMSYRNLFLFWIGDGEDRLAIERWAKDNLPSDRLLISGWLAVDEALEYMELTDIFVSTAIFESFGYMTCEAMAKAKPIVGTDIPGTSDLVRHGTNGFLVPARSPLQLATELGCLIESRELRERMGGESLRLFREKFTLERMRKEVECVYRNAVAG